MPLFIRLVTSTIAIFVASYLLSSGVHVDGWVTALIVAIVLGVINMFIKPLITILTLPITIVTFGLSFVINALLVMLADYLVPNFTIDSFWWALAFSLLASLIASFLNTMLKER